MDDGEDSLVPADEGLQGCVNFGCEVEKERPVKVD